MTVYKYFIKISLRHKWIIISYTAIFLLLSIINGTNIEEKEASFIEKQFNIGVIDKSNSNLSKELIKYLNESNNISQIKDNSYDYIKEQIFMEVIDAAIVIPKDFEEKLRNKDKSIEIIRDDRKMESIKIENEINKFLIFLNATAIDNEFNVEKVKQALNEEVSVEVLSAENTSKNQNIDNWFKNYFNFTGYVIIAIYIAVIGLVMTELNNKNIQSRIKISSKKFMRFNIEVYLGQATLGVLITLVFILGSIVIKGKYLSDVNLLKYLLSIYVFSFTILCFTFLISNLTTNKFTINVISTITSLGTSFISGILVPQELLGEKVLRISKFFPTYYFVKINETSMFSFADIKYDVFMQLLFSITFLVMGLYFSKIKANKES